MQGNMAKRSKTHHRQDDRPVTSLEVLYTELNRELFCGRLHDTVEVTFEWKDPSQMRGALGDIRMKWGHRMGQHSIPLRGSVKIRVRTGMTPRQTRKTMAHEMAHLSAAMEDGTLKHNGTFWRVMDSIGYGKHHRFEGEEKGERDLYTEKSEARQAVWFWRKQSLGTRVAYGQGVYFLTEVQKRGTKVRISNSMGFSWWVPAKSVKPL